MDSKQDLLSKIILFFMLVIVLSPIVWMFLLSITPRQHLFQSFIPPYFTLKNYIYTFNETNVLMSYRNSWFIASGVVVLSLAIGAPAAYALSRYEFRIKPHLVVLIVITQMLPMTLLATAYLRIVSSLGLYNTLFALIIVNSTNALPLVILLLKSTFDTIPRELEQAAMIDGCSRFGAFTRVALPIASAGIFAAGFFAFEEAWIEFLYALTLTSDIASRPLTVEITARLGHYVIDWGQMMAMSFALSLPVFILFLTFQKSLLRGFTAGALKE